MITQNIKKFKLGVDPYPDWFKGYDQSKLNYNTAADGTLISVDILIGRGKKNTAYVGDTIGLLTDGVLIVIPKSVADKYM